MADDDPPEDQDTPHPDPDDDLADAVEDALDPARHDAVMTVWQQVVLGRLDHPEASPDLDELRRRIDEDQPPDDPA